MERLGFLWEDKLKKNGLSAPVIPNYSLEGFQDLTSRPPAAQAPVGIGQTIEAPLLPGAVGMSRNRPPVNVQTGLLKGLIKPDRVSSLMDAVVNSNNVLRKLSIGADGSFAMESDPGFLPQSPMQGELQGIDKPVGEPRPMGNLAPDTFQQETKTEKPWWQKAGDFLTSPEAGYLYGKVGAAIATPGSPQAQIGELGAQMNMNTIYQSYLNDLRAGKKPEELNDRKYGFLPAEMKSKALEEIYTTGQRSREEEKFQVEKQAFELEKIAQEYKNLDIQATTAYTKKLAAGTLTAEEKKQQADMDRAIQLGIAEYNPKEDWIGLGSGFAFNPKSREYIMAVETGDGTHGMPGGKIPAADLVQIESQVSDLFIAEAVEARRAELISKAPDKETAKEIQESADIIEFFKDADSGIMRVRTIKSYLPPESATQFDKYYAQYLDNYARGQHYGTTQVAQSEDLLKREINGEVWLVREIQKPDGSVKYKPIKPFPKAGKK
jgi:hypothetical protein